jgi:hypothetical protein
MTMLTLSGMNKDLGRWGNQVIQYAFLKTCAKRWGWSIQVRPWMGSEWFGHVDAPLSAKLKQFDERSVGVYPVPPTKEVVADRDYRGWAQFYSTWYAPDRDYIQGMFQLTAEHAERFVQPIERLRTTGETIIGMHFRTGDNGWKNFYLSPIPWWKAWLARHWHDYHHPVLLIVAQDYSVADMFSAYKPVTPVSVGVEYSPKPYPHYCYLDEDMKRKTPLEMDFFPDWCLLANCDVVVGSNSTFSWTAAWVNPKLREYWRTQLPTASIERESVWSSYPTQYYFESEFPNVPGAWVNQNDYWKYQNPTGTKRGV